MTPTFYNEPQLEIPVIIGSNPYLNVNPAQTDIIPEDVDQPSDVILQQPPFAKNTLEPKY